MKTLKLISNLRDPLRFSVFFGSAAILLSASYLIMAALPGERDNMCVIGGGLTFGNFVFAALMSLSAGLILAGYAKLLSSEWVGHRLAMGSLSGSAFVVSVLTLFCTLCTIPLVSLFGLSLTLWFVSQYVIWFQIVSLVFMGLALFLMEHQLRGICFKFP